jgi:excisionase family DNA binding protein
MKEAIEEIPAIMTARELAAFLKMSKKWGHQTIGKMACKGEIRGFKVGDLWRFTRAQVQAYLVGKR